MTEETTAVGPICGKLASIASICGVAQPHSRVNCRNCDVSVTRLRERRLVVISAAFNPGQNKTDVLGRIPLQKLTLRWGK